MLVHIPCGIGVPCDIAPEAVRDVRLIQAKRTAQWSHSLHFHMRPATHPVDLFSADVSYLHAAADVAIGAQVTHAPTPCLACGITAFCSDACAEVASDSWHGNECLDSFGQPLGPALSGMSTEYRVALRALRRAERDEPLDDGGSEIGESSVPIAAVDAAARCHGEASDGNTSRRLGDQITSMSAIGFNDLQEHYDERKPRERDLLGTEAAVAAVLAHGVGDHEGRGHEASYRNACGNLAAQLASTLVKVCCVIA